MEEGRPAFVDPGLAVRRTVDRWIGVAPWAVHARLAACFGGLVVAFQVPDAHSVPLHFLSFTLLLLAFGVAPGIIALERTYGRWPMTVAFFLAVLAVPLLFAGAFTSLFFDPGQKPSSRSFFLGVAALGRATSFWVVCTAWRYVAKDRI